MNQAQYDTLSKPFRESKQATAAIAGINKLLTTVGYVTFPLVLVLEVACGSWPLAVRTALTAGISFCALSLFRAFYNAPRPYETLNIVPLIEKDTKGKSFPSRHVFSFFMIAFCWLVWLPPVGIILCIASLALAAIRVIVGVHWPRDVIVAFMFAAVAAIIGFVLIP